jgi:predicted MPP superfamily phosphohydrolase
MWLSRGRLGSSKTVRFVRRLERSIFLPELPEPLDGLRIVHLSDLHIGQLVHPDRLPTIIEAANAMRPDLIALTGDLVDLSLSVLDPVIQAVTQLSARFGLFIVPGNHDYLEDGPQFIRRLRGAGLPLMINENQLISVHGCRLRVLGIDYDSSPKRMEPMLGRAMDQPYHQSGERTAAALAVPSSDDSSPDSNLDPENRGLAHGPDSGALVNRGTSQSARCLSQPEDFKLLLAHHPHAFEAAQPAGVDLTLSGHTHGGQLVWPGSSTKGSISLGGLACRYTHGLYQRGQRYLHVTSGVGTWFPWRVNCPAEIVCLTLRSGSMGLNEPSHP